MRRRPIRWWLPRLARVPRTAVDATVTAVWAAQQLRRLRRDLESDGVRAAVARPPRARSRRAGHALMATARLGRATCLERSLLRQAWLRERGMARDVVIGVRRDESFAAHAWLEGDGDGAGYVEMHRISAAAAPAATGMPGPEARIAPRSAGPR